MGHDSRVLDSLDVRRLSWQLCIELTEKPCRKAEEVATINAQT